MKKIISLSEYPRISKDRMVSLEESWVLVEDCDKRYQTRFLKTF